MVTLRWCTGFLTLFTLTCYSLNPTMFLLVGFIIFATAHKRTWRRERTRR